MAVLSGVAKEVAKLRSVVGHPLAPPLATARAGTFVHVFEERALRAQYLFRARLT